MRKARTLDASDPAAIEEAAAVIRKGGLVAFPTETVYGLGADACNPVAVARIFEVKRRPRIDPIIVHVSNPRSAGLYGILPEIVTNILMPRFWPGPLTLVVPKTGLIPRIVTAGLDTVAIRMPSHPAALALIRSAGRAVAAPSANLFGHVSPTEAIHVSEQLSDRIDLILDGGRCPVGIESTVLSVAEEPPRILRAGGIPPEALEAALGQVVSSRKERGRPRAPGQLARHYSTRTPLRIAVEGDRDAEPGSGERVGLLALLPPTYGGQYAAVEVLSLSGDLCEAAANLFAALHRLDAMNLDRIVARPVPEEGLGVAIQDRLRRCAAGPPGDDR